MKPMRWLAWSMNAVLLVALVVSGVHEHAGGAVNHTCVVCAVGHAPAVPSVESPVPHAPEPTCEVVVERPAVAFPAPSGAIPASRAPPLG